MVNRAHAGEHEAARGEDEGLAVGPRMREREATLLMECGGFLLDLWWRSYGCGFDTLMVIVVMKNQRWRGGGATVQEALVVWSTTSR